MKTRAELKNIAKENVKNTYWIAVGAFALYALVVPSLATIPNLGWVVTILISAPLSVGLISFFSKISRKEEVEVFTPVKDTFDESYGKKLGGVLWMYLWIFLWSLLLYIPGIVKSFSYAMSPYILANCPNVKAKEALNISKRIMDGHKAELFVLQLSFILWYLLSILTFGILILFYVGPYTNATYVEYYNDLLQESINNGIVSREELGLENTEENLVEISE